MKNHLLLICVCVSAFLTMAIVFVKNRQVPYVLFELQSENGSKYERGEVFDANCVVWNNGPKAVNITDSLLSCGCTQLLRPDGSPLEFPLTVTPGETVEMESRIAVSGPAGRRFVEVGLLLDDESTRSIEIHFEVLENAAISPAVLEIDMASLRADVPPYVVVGHRPNEQCLIREIGCELPISSCKPIVVNPENAGDYPVPQPYPDWEPRSILAIDLDRSAISTGMTSSIKVWINDEKTPRTVRVVFVDTNAIACQPDLLIYPFVSGGAVVSVEGLEEDSKIEILPKGAFSARVARRTKSRIILELQYADGPNAPNWKEKVLTLQESKGGRPTGRTAMLRIKHLP